MSVDERLQSALRDQAETFVPAVETALDRVHAEGRAARWRTALVALAGAAATVAVIGGAVVWLGSPRPGSTPPTSTSSVTAATPDHSASPSPLRGSISAEVTRPVGLAGTWRLQLHGNGTMEVEPPGAYAGDVDGALFTADGSILRTTLFQADMCAGESAGIYDWLESDGQIQFDVVSDPCPPRVRFFEESTWLVSTKRARRG